MHVIDARNVNDAYDEGRYLLSYEGEHQPSRNGSVLVLPTPLTICYSYPQERVLFNSKRDANPFFHVFEALWMISGRQDATWLDRFVSDFSSRFAEDGGLQHGAYGYRWRSHFDVEGGGHPLLPDQLEIVIDRLRKDPNDRRVVIQMWDPVADLGAEKRDVPCNLIITPRIRTEPWIFGNDQDTRQVLDITVFCRSNDFVWGMAGANAVHFSFLQEYLAGRIGVEVGRYYQIANNAHIYSNILPKLGAAEPSAWEEDPYADGVMEAFSIGHDWERWDSDLKRFMAWTESEEPDQEPQEYPTNPWFQHTAEPLFVAHNFWRKGDREHALEVSQLAEGMSPDWRLAAIRWMQRRLNKEKP